MKEATLIYRGGCDLCYQHDALLTIANAIASRYDAGICKHKYEHPGVVEVYRVDEVGCCAENLASSNPDRKPSLEKSDVAHTVLARDYKGISNYPSNVVLEIYEVKNGTDNTVGADGRKL